MPGEPSRSARGNGLVSYRLSLVVAIPLLVILTGGAIAENSYVTTRLSIRSLAASLFRQVADQTAERARAHLAQAPPAVDLLAALYGADEHPLSVDDSARRLLAVMRANGGFAWATFNRPDGSIVGIHRLRDRTLLVHESHFEGGASRMTERTVVDDATWTPFRAEDDDHYDPRTRPFFARATSARRRVWMEPYVFFHEGVPGVSCAAPVYERDGALRGVVTVDFDLNILSDFVTKLRASEHARVFVYTSDGVILAHPTLRVVGQEGRGAAGELLTKDNVPDDVLRAYFAAGDAGSFVYGGESYLSATRSFDPDDGLSWRVGAVAPEADFMEGVDRTTRFSLLASLLAVVVAVGVSRVFASKVAAPLAHLSVEMEKIGRFELEATAVPSSMFREIASMYQALGTMKTGLWSFASYVPRDVVRAVLKSGEKAVLGGRTKELTVLFSDLAGFTSLSETMPPAELVSLLGVYFDEMTRIIGQHGGTVDKFIGDAIMAFWNAPGDDADHAAHACLAALACTRRLSELKATRPEMSKLSARIGVATGAVLVGNIGSHERLNYSVMGDTVNLASRLEGLCKSYGSSLLVSESTYAAARERLTMSPVDVVAVKGKARGIRVYEPLAARDDSAAVRHALLAEKALALYLERRFEEARAGYDAVLAEHPTDEAARTMRARSDEYAAHPPPEGWDGVRVMSEK